MTVSSDGVRIVASLMCADLSRLAAEIEALEAAGADGFHFDIMDGAFVPNLAFGPVFLAAVRSRTRLPFEAHLMVQDPVPLVRPLADAGCDLCMVHAESTGGLRATIQAIRDAGMIPGVAINPTTSLSRIAEALPEVACVVVMTVEPGFAGQPMVRNANEKVGATADLIAAARSQAGIEVDGNINPRTVRPLVEAGARILVGGSSGLFLAGEPYSVTLPRLRASAEGRPDPRGD